MVPSADRVHPELVIASRYRLIRPLDSGAMGEVWIANEDGVRDVAVKIIKQAQRSPELVERFRREIAVAAALHSEYIVKVFHWGELNDGRPFMVMDLLQGQNLAAVIREQRRIPITDAVDYVVQACAALVEAHRKMVVHRDLKPANLFLTPDGIKVLDFGVAKALEGDRPDQTEHGEFLGTLMYSAPEQLGDARLATARSDIWSIGAVLYELICGRPAFGGRTKAAVKEAILYGSTPDILRERPEAGAALARCIACCLDKDPRRRWSTAAELISALAPHGSSASNSLDERFKRGSDGRTSQSDEGASVDGAPSSHVRATTMEREEDQAATTPVASSTDYGSEDDLVQALTAPIQSPEGHQRDVVLMLGSGFSVPVGKTLGVPGAAEIVTRIERHLSPEPSKRLRSKLATSKNKYQEAFSFLALNDSRDAANRLIREAVLEAKQGERALPHDPQAAEEACRRYEREGDWDMPPGVVHLGEIVAHGLKQSQTDRQKGAAAVRFARLHLTTNFDPLLAISIRRAGGVIDAQSVDGDHEISRPHDQLCRLIHLHGYWSAGDTLHTQLDAPRRRLEDSLRKLLGRSTLVVLGYGGWDDVFMRTLGAVASGAQYADVRWAFFENDPHEIQRKNGGMIARLQQSLGQRIAFYRGVDTNRLFEKLRGELVSEHRRSRPNKAALVSGATLLLSLVVALLMIAPRLMDDSGLVGAPLEPTAAAAQPSVAKPEPPPQPAAPAQPAPVQPAPSQPPPSASPDKTSAPGLLTQQRTKVAITLEGDCQRVDAVRATWAKGGSEAARVEASCTATMSLPKELVGKRVSIEFEPPVVSPVEVVLKARTTVALPVVGAPPDDSAKLEACRACLASRFDACCAPIRVRLPYSHEAECARRCPKDKSQCKDCSP